MALCTGCETLRTIGGTVGQLRTVCCTTRNMGCCDRVSGNAPVLMMEAADVREGGDIALVRLLGRSWFWVPLVECKMHLRCVIEKNRREEVA